MQNHWESSGFQRMYSCFLDGSVTAISCCDPKRPHLSMASGGLVEKPSDNRQVTSVWSNANVVARVTLAASLMSESTLQRPASQSASSASMTLAAALP